ncbi:MAG: SGNH/GDSL hydrolase family protein [Bryobacteraceae bacterium]
MTRSQFFFFAGAFVAFAQNPTAEIPVRWHDLASLPIEGKGWSDTKHFYDRLPARAEGVVRAPVWNLSHDSAGMLYRFSTDAPLIRARWKLRKPDRLAMPHMPATGVSGLDLYVLDAGDWRWLANGRPTAGTNEQTLVRDLPRRPREFALYLPLYNGVESVELGLPEGFALQASTRYQGRKPVVFYGTSILQGGCASRPGMAYPAIVGRMLDWPTINLGFSGNGKTEPEMADLLSELDPALYVMDSLPNLSVQEVSERVEPFVRKLRAKHPDTPIVFAENVNYTDSGMVEARRSKVAEANALLRGIFDNLKKAGAQRIFYVPAWQLYGGDGEDTVDGAHATDLGFLRMAEGIAPVIREALASAGLRVPSEEGFQSAFDGKSLSGWKQRQGKWRAAAGVLSGSGLILRDQPMRGLLMRFEFMLDAPSEGRVLLHAGQDGPGLEVALDGSIPAVHPNPEGVRAIRKEGWNSAEVRIEGQPARIRYWLNGRLLTDFQHTEATAKGAAADGKPGFASAAGHSLRIRSLRVQSRP